MFHPLWFYRPHCLTPHRRELLVLALWLTVAYSPCPQLELSSPQLSPRPMSRGTPQETWVCHHLLRGAVSLLAVTASTTLGDSRPALTRKVPGAMTQETLPWLLVGHFVGGRHNWLVLWKPFRWSQWSRGGLEVLLPLLELGKLLLLISSCEAELLLALRSRHCRSPHELVFQPILQLTMPESVMSL